MAKQGVSPRNAEKPADWTEVVLTRVSKRADKLLNDKVSASMGSRSAYIRKLLYEHLGIADEGV